MGKKIIKIIIRGYQIMISPFFSACCRYHPTCSEYMIQSINKWGANKGLYLGFKRLLCCHPFSKRSNVDPV